MQYAPLTRKGISKIVMPFYNDFLKKWPELFDLMNI